MEVKPRIKRCWWMQTGEPIWGVFRYPGARRPVVMGQTLAGIAQAAFWSNPYAMRTAKPEVRP